MTAAQQIPLMTVADYLAFEESAEVRHEYVGGFLYAMAGSKNVHSRVATRFLTIMDGQLEHKPCEPFNSDAKVRIKLPTHTRFYYPDAMVVCEPNSDDETFHDRPVVIAEVLSDSTRRIDEGEKREAYLSIPSLAVYLLVETASPVVRLFRRTPEGFVSEQHTGLEAVVPLPEIECELALARLYERVDFSPASQAERLDLDPETTKHAIHDGINVFIRDVLIPCGIVDEEKYAADKGLTHSQHKVARRVAEWWKTSRRIPDSDG